MPYAWRRNPNAYNYYRKIRQGSSGDIEMQEINEEEDCVICMNPIAIEVEQESVDQANMSVAHQNDGQPKKAKEYMKTPCNHKYHVPCLKRWMDIRLECPSCR